jgi:hypothetical protein
MTDARDRREGRPGPIREKSRIVSVVGEAAQSVIALAFRCATLVEAAGAGIIVLLAGKVVDVALLQVAADLFLSDFFHVGVEVL